MKTTIVLSIFCASLAACSPDATPMDMEYNVNVETLEDTCGNDPAPEGLTVPLNVALQKDGSMTVSYPTGYTPGRGDYKDFIIYDGETDITYNRPSKTESGDNIVHIYGDLTKDFVNLIIEERRWRADSETEPAPCVRKARLRGAARPFWTVAALDGKYEAYYDFYGQVCPSGQQPLIPISWTVPLDISDQNGSALFAFDSHDEILIFSMQTEMLASGKVNWKGEIYLAVLPFNLYELEGKVVGKFMDGTYSLRMDFHDIGDGTGCEFILEAAGTKRAPNQAEISNVYRLALSKSDTCKPDADGNPTTDAFEQEGDAVLRTNGQLTLMHGIKRFNLDPQTDGTYANHWTGGGETLDYAASVVPPNLSFSSTRRKPTQNGTCDITYQAVGVPRYFPDLALNFPKTANAKPRLVGSEPKSFGLAAKIKDHARMRPFSEAPAIVREAIEARTLRR